MPHISRPFVESPYKERIADKKVINAALSALEITEKQLNISRERERALRTVAGDAYEIILNCGEKGYYDFQIKNLAGSIKSFLDKYDAVIKEET